MGNYENRIKMIKGTRFPFEFFKGQKVKLVLMDNREFKGVLLNHNFYDIDIVTNIGTESNPEKGTLKVHMSHIKYIIENNKGYRRKKKKKKEDK
ncbi:hypothetical protein [Staphylococcus shinii]|uniref:hypothetical protein n=1 Tax=Staphylococcus shinii TaxID=2912228 RepID=UPI003EEA0F75